jgi:hypothetical protein
VAQLYRAESLLVQSSQPLALVNGREQTLRVDARGNQITVFVDGVEQIRHTEIDALPYGVVSLWADSTANNDIFVTTFSLSGIVTDERSIIAPSQASMNASARLIDTPMNADEHGDIVFQCSSFNLDRSICTINSDGSNFRILLDGSANNYYPAWSPDGNKIAYESDHDGGYHIWILDLNLPQDTTNPRNITLGRTGYNTSPRWSPDGSQILFGSDGLYLASLTMPTPVISEIPLPDGLDPYWVADWSPQGDQVVFTTSGESGIYVVTLATGSASRIVTPGIYEEVSNVTWSPIGNEIAYDWWFDDGLGLVPEVVKIVDLASLNVRTLDTIGASPFHKDPAWSPDGTQIALSGNPMRKVSAQGGDAVAINNEIPGFHADGEMN